MKIPIQHDPKSGSLEVTIEDETIRHWCRVIQEEYASTQRNNSAGTMTLIEWNEEFLNILELCSRMPGETERELLWRAVDGVDDVELKEITDSIVEERYSKTAWFLLPDHRERVENALYQTFAQVRDQSHYEGVDDGDEDDDNVSPELTDESQS